MPQILVMAKGGMTCRARLITVEIGALCCMDVLCKACISGSDPNHYFHISADVSVCVCVRVCVCVCVLQGTPAG